MIASPQEIIAPDLGSPGTSVNNKKNSRFDLFTNIFKKRTKDLDPEPPTTTDRNLVSPPLNGPGVHDDLYEDKETSVVPTLTCNTTAISAESPPAPTILPHVTTPIRSSQPIEIFNPMGHPGHEPSLAGEADNQYEHFSATPTVLTKSPVSPRVRSLQHDMQALRRSRQDNPYIQHKLERLSLQEEPPFSSPRKQEQEKLVESEDDSEMEDEAVNLHEHLIRSPPPQFPQNVSQFMFPDRTGSPRLMMASSIDSLTLQPANLNADSPIIPIIRPEGNLFRPKGSLPLLPIEEVQNPVDFNNRSNNFQKSDLNPLLIKSGVDMLDPSMREVLEFQKHKIVYDNRGDPAVSPAENNGRMSVDAALHHHSISGVPGHPYQRVAPINGKLQPMWSPPATAPSFPTSPRPVSFPTGGPVVVGATGPSAPNYSPLPSLNTGPILPPVSGAILSNESGLKPVKGVRLLPTPNNVGQTNGSRTMVI